MMDVEKAFNAFVKSFGGELVSELLPKSPSFGNADYLFRLEQEEPVVAELKCLTQDWLKEGYREKIDALFEDWIERDLIPPFWGQHRINSRDLPLQCQEEWARLYEKPIKRLIARANNQIKQTKRHFGLQGAKGLLLLVNDGNFSLEFGVLTFLLSRVLARDYTSINSVACFTVNVTARIADSEQRSLIWLPLHRPDMPTVSPTFLDKLRDDWVQFHAVLVGEPGVVSRLGTSQLVEQIKLVQPPEPREYFKTRHHELLNLRREIAAHLSQILLGCRFYDEAMYDEAGRIALAAGLLLGGLPKGRFLLREYFGDREIHLRSTTMLGAPDRPNGLGFMALEVNTVQFRPVLNKTVRDVLLPVGEWWDEPVVKISTKHGLISRRQIVLGHLWESGQAELDGAIAEKFQIFSSGLGFAAGAMTADGRKIQIPFQNANYAALRQIAHELLTSQELRAFL